MSSYKNKEKVILLGTGGENSLAKNNNDTS